MPKKIKNIVWLEFITVFAFLTLCLLASQVHTLDTISMKFQIDGTFSLKVTYDANFLGWTDKGTFINPNLNF